MTTPSAPSPISLNDVNVELGNPGTTLITLNDSAVRGLAGAPFATPGTTISLNDLRGKTRSVSATGGTVSTPGDGFRYHTFISPGSFVVSNLGPGTIQVLVVGGGGGGGGLVRGAGGGGGAVITNLSFPISVTTYPVTVGGGGAGAISPTSEPFTSPAASGGNSSIFSSITSPGGGGATSAPSPGSGSGPPPAGGTGGSPGGGNGGAGPGPTGFAGNPGSNGTQVPTAFTAPNFGVPSLNPLSRYFGGGGGSGYWDAPANSFGNGGLGGGGRGGGEPPIYANNQGDPGVTNSGGGGGGGTDPLGAVSRPQNGGSGGSGIVVIRYPI